MINVYEMMCRRSSLITEFSSVFNNLIYFENLSIKKTHTGVDTVNFKRNLIASTKHERLESCLCHKAIPERCFYSIPRV